VQLADVLAFELVDIHRKRVGRGLNKPAATGPWKVVLMMDPRVLRDISFLRGGPELDALESEGVIVAILMRGRGRVKPIAGRRGRTWSSNRTFFDM
jgi:hypothetical protein